MKLVRALVGAVLLAACAAAPDGPAGSPPRASVVLELRAQRDAPSASLSYGARSSEAPPATYCWGQRCVDAFGFPPPTETIRVPAGVRLELRGDAAEADVSIAEPPADGADSAGPAQPGPAVQELRGLEPGNGGALDVPPGRYWVVVFARWESEGGSTVVGGGGDATFAFAIRVR